MGRATVFFFKGTTNLMSKLRLLKTVSVDYLYINKHPKKVQFFVTSKDHFFPNLELKIDELLDFWKNWLRQPHHLFGQIRCISPTYPEYPRPTKFTFILFFLNFSFFRQNPKFLIGPKGFTLNGTWFIGLNRYFPLFYTPKTEILEK